MTSLSDIAPLSPKERAVYGVARVKSVAFDAVHALWRRRKAEGKTQAELAMTLGKDEGWLSKNLRGPGNWTMKTFGELVEALDGELEIIVHGMEDTMHDVTNSHAYAGYECSWTNIPTKKTGFAFSDGSVIETKNMTGSQTSAFKIFR